MVKATYKFSPTDNYFYKCEFIFVTINIAQLKMQNIEKNKYSQSHHPKLQNDYHLFPFSFIISSIKYAFTVAWSKKCGMFPFSYYLF